MDRAEVHRRFFAELITAQAGVPPGRLLDAFAMTPRERFIGPAPWKFPTFIGYIEAPSDDVTFLYRNCPVALAPERGINNGQPVLHAMSLAALDPQPGETAIHVGAGGPRDRGWRGKRFSPGYPPRRGSPGRHWRGMGGGGSPGAPRRDQP